MFSLHSFARWSRHIGCLAFIPGIAITAYSAEIIEVAPPEPTSQYAWHLAVLNGGQPRGAREAQDLSVDARPLAINSDEQSFGPAGATPITGDFNGDGNTEIGAYLDGQWFIDLDGNGRWDGHDLWVSFGSKGDQPVTGDWDGDGKTDIGVFGAAWAGDVASDAGLPDAEGSTRSSTAASSDQQFYWQRGESARTMAGPVTHTFFFGMPGDKAVAGDFNGDGIDTVGIYRHGRWVLDVDGDGRYGAADRSIEFGELESQPLVGDFNGDGTDELAVWSSDGLQIFGVEAASQELAQAAGLPIIGDFRGLGHDEVVMFRTIQ